MKLVRMCLGARKRGSVWFWGWDSKLGPCWDPFLPRQLQPFSKFGWEGKKGKVLYLSTKCLLWARITASCRKMYLAFPLESFWVEMTIGLVGGGGLGGALQLLEDTDRPPAKTKQEREGLRNRVGLKLFTATSLLQQKGSRKVGKDIQFGGLRG